MFLFSPEVVGFLSPMKEPSSAIQPWRHSFAPRLMKTDLGAAGKSSRSFCLFFRLDPFLLFGRSAFLTDFCFICDYVRRQLFFFSSIGLGVVCASLFLDGTVEILLRLSESISGFLLLQFNGEFISPPGHPLWGRLSIFSLV